MTLQNRIYQSQIRGLQEGMPISETMGAGASPSSSPSMNSVGMGKHMGAFRGTPLRPGGKVSHGEGLGTQNRSQVMEWLQTLSQEQQQMWRDLFSLWNELGWGANPNVATDLFNGLVSSIGNPNWDWSAFFNNYMPNSTITNMGSNFGLDNLVLIQGVGDSLGQTTDNDLAIGWNSQTGQWEILHVD